MRNPTRRNLTFGFLAFFATAAGANHARAASFREDVAIDLQTGDTFIVDQDGTSNTLGQIEILNDHDETYARSVFVGAADRYEIEKVAEDKVAYLVQRDGFWAISLIQKNADSGEWAVVPASHAVGGTGDAEGLHSLPGGDLVVSTDSKVLKISQTAQGGLAVNGQVDPAEFESQASGAAEASSLQPVTPKDGQGQPKVYDSGNGLGFAAGYQSAVGIAYRRHLQNKWGFQVAAGGWGDTDSLFLNAGATVMRTLSKTEIVRFYAMGGAGVFFDSSSYDNYVCPTDEYGNPTGDCTIDGQVTTSSTMLNIGVGIGIEFRILKRVGIAIELPITTSLIVQSTDEWNATGFNGITMIPNGSLIYYF